MSRSITTHIDIDQLVREARLQRSAALGRMILDGAQAIGGLFAKAFGSDEGPLRATGSTSARNRLTSLANER